MLEDKDVSITLNIYTQIFIEESDEKRFKRIERKAHLWAHLKARDLQISTTWGLKLED